MKNIMKEAHNLTKRIIKAGDNYRATFRLCLSFVHSQIKKGVEKMIELVGSEKQVKWANDIRLVVVEALQHDVKIREDRLKEKQHKRRVRLLEEAKQRLEKIENETSAKYFINEFAWVLKSKVEFEKIEKDVEGYCAIDELSDKILYCFE